MDLFQELGEPAGLWRWFGEICSVPHPSGREAALAERIASLVKRELPGCAVRRDAAGNLRIDRGGAAPGTPLIMLQAHLDMVPQSAGNFDFESQGIPLEISGGFLRSGAGTSLGADDGIGVAAALAALASAPAGLNLAALFTVREETGLQGALALSPDMLECDALLNLDSEEEGVIYTGCAGGETVTAEFRVPYQPPSADTVPAVITVGGLKGGHSGSNIADRRGNALLLLFSVLRGLDGMFSVSSLSGGTLDNVIPASAAVSGYCRPDDFPVIGETLLRAEREFRRSCDAQPEFGIVLSRTDAGGGAVWTSGFLRRFLDIFDAGFPDGVLEYSAEFRAVRTSSNLASAKMPSPGTLILTGSQRSLRDAERKKATERFSACFSAAGAAVSRSGGYPGWEPSPDSPLSGTASAFYRRCFGVLPQVRVIHAGLECGIFAGKAPGLPMISFGPTLLDVHSVNERLDIASARRFFSYLSGLLPHLSASIR